MPDDRSGIQAPWRRILHTEHAEVALYAWARSNRERGRGIGAATPI